MDETSFTPLVRARVALEGLSVGDAFGERFFGEPREVSRRIRARELPPGPWRYTDDTEMALSVVEELEAHGGIDQDALAERFARRLDPERGYGRGALMLLTFVRAGMNWRAVSKGSMGGEGSYGNGAAMRVAPLGAWFADDLERAAAEARLSAEVTHAHPEGIAGAVGVAVAAALAWRGRGAPLEAAGFLEQVAAAAPAGATREGLEKARGLPAGIEVGAAAEALGNGAAVSAPDTVPFCVWMASRGLTYEESLWRTASASGDVDTTCAIVGGIVAAREGLDAVPRAWRLARESLPK